MKNITVAIPEAVYTKARVYAAERNTSVSAMVREYLAEVTQGIEDSQKRAAVLQELWAQLDNRRASGRPHFDASDRLTREQLYDEAFRGHKRSPL